MWRDELTYGFRTGVNEGRTEPPMMTGRRGGDDPPGSTGPPETGKGGPPKTAEPPKEEAGRGADSRAETTDEPPINRAEETTPDEAPTEEATEVPIKGGPEAEGERYAAMNAVPPNVLLVGDGAQRPTIISKPEESR